MKKVFLFFIFACLVSCGLNQMFIKEQEVMGNSMITVYDEMFSNEQFDSICAADTLPEETIHWIFVGFRDYETKKPNGFYLYRKLVDGYETVYKVERISVDSVKVNKRITF